MGTYQMVAVAAATGISIFLLFVGIISMVQRKHESVQRLENYVSPDQSNANIDQAQAGPLADIDHWLAHLKFGTSISRSLAQADIKLTVSEFLLLHLAMLAAGLLIGPLLFKSAIGGIFLAVPLLLLPKFYVASAQRKRLQSFNEQLPAALDSLSNSLRGGYGLVQAMKLVSAEMQPPLSVEFQRVVSEVSYGLPYDTAFKNMLRRNGSPDLSMIVTAIEINLEVGGNLSDILDNIGAIIRDRVRIQGQVKAYTSQTRLSSMVLTGLPFGLGALIFVVNPTYISALWTTTLGLVMLGIAGTMVTIGSIVLSKMAKIDV
jgi:tight adherence protein B